MCSNGAQSFLTITMDLYLPIVCRMNKITFAFRVLNSNVVLS